MLAAHVSAGVFDGSFVLAAIAAFSSLSRSLSALTFSSSNFPL